MSLTDHTPMPYGKYKGTPMANVPADYLLWLYENDRCSDDVRDYIFDNLDIIKAEVGRKKII